MFDSVEHPIGYASRTLTETETKYTVSEKEMLAIVWASEHFYHYIYGHKVILITDHKPLADLKCIKMPKGRLGTLLYKIQNFDYEIKYKHGHLNANADVFQD